MIIASYCMLGAAGTVYICLPYFLYRDPKLYLHFHWILVVHIVQISVDYLFTVCTFFVTRSKWQSYVMYRFGLLTVLCAFFWSSCMTDQFHCKEKRYYINVSTILYYVSLSFWVELGKTTLGGHLLERWGITQSLPYRTVYDLRCWMKALLEFGSVYVSTC